MRSPPGLCSAPENNAENLFLLLWENVVSVCRLGTPALLCAFCKERRRLAQPAQAPAHQGVPAAPFSTPISLSLQR